ncbi:MAG: Fe-S cluster assembly protein SufD [Planctomycetes bacterium]|nr:Fe-S cluster assembly protein SufD [Planctomycetota bacterium]
MIQLAETKAPATAPRTGTWLSAFAAQEPGLPGRHLPWLVESRKSAIVDFAEMGFPTTAHEDWRATSVAPIVETAFRPAPAPAAGAVTAAAIADSVYEGVEAARLVFVDGHYAPALSHRAALPAGVRIGTLGELLAADPRALESQLGRIASPRAHAFVALNTAFFRDGAFVHLPARTVVERPIHVLYVATGAGEPTVAHPRALFLADRESKAVLVETFVGLGSGVYLTNAVSELVVGENAHIEHLKIQRESLGAFHVATLSTRQAQNCSFTSHSIALGGSLVRNDLNTLVDGPGITTTLNGVYRVFGTQHLDNHTSIDHAKAHSVSRELYKGILEGKAKAVFNGKIIVRKDAQQTDAHQANKNLLLSDEAIIDTKPQLEIFANDVKCKHGATIGHISPDAVFYLRTRGLPEADARRLVIHAFLLEILREISGPALRERQARWLYALLGGEPEAAIEIG